MPYTDEVKAEGLRLLEEENVWAAVRATGASHVTIYRWHAAHVRSLKKEPAEVEIEETENRLLRARLDRRFLETALAHVDRSDATADASAALKWMTAAGIATDKYRLEMGEATSRSITEGADDIDRSVAQLVAELARRGETQIP